MCTSKDDPWFQARGLCCLFLLFCFVLNKHVRTRRGLMCDVGLVVSGLCGSCVLGGVNAEINFEAFVYCLDV